MNDIRRPEGDLEVLWQLHVPQGVGAADDDTRVDAVADLQVAVEGALEAYMGAEPLDSGDLVVTISRRRNHA